MAWFLVLVVVLVSLSANPTFSRVHRNFPPEADEDSVQLISLTNPFNFSSSTSFSSQFNFTIGNGVALVIIPADFPSKFGTNTSFEVLDAHHFLGIKFYAYVCEISYSGVTNVSKTSNVLKGGVNLSSWIEYQPTSKRLEVRLSKVGDPKPVEPLVSVLVDLGEILKGEKVMLGRASSNEKQITSRSLQITDSITREDSRVQNPNRQQVVYMLWMWMMWMFLMTGWCE
ncbi:uncharacterized protein LOC143629238 [Bidens hawaiensis]|uniref:uncharacterized protein LOC143629238 n=1 Tax=Bidens hawaiensis TaxID=980011 RepID=UPI00404ACD8F